MDMSVQVRAGCVYMHMVCANVNVCGIHAHRSLHKCVHASACKFCVRCSRLSVSKFIRRQAVPGEMESAVVFPNPGAARALPDPPRDAGLPAGLEVLAPARLSLALPTRGFGSGPGGGAMSQPGSRGGVWSPAPGQPPWASAPLHTPHLLCLLAEELGSSTPANQERPPNQS